MRVVSERGIEAGDVVVMDLECFTETPGGGRTPIPSATQKKFRFQTHEQKDFLPGLVENILGLKFGCDAATARHPPHILRPTSCVPQSCVPQSCVRIRVCSEAKEFSVTFPSTWQPRPLAGATALCKATIHEIFEYDLVALDDSLAAQIAPDCSTTSEARAALLARVTADREELNKRKVDEALLDAVAGETPPRHLRDSSAPSSP